MGRSLAVVILAAGKGKRMLSDLPKVMFPICGKPALHYPLEAARSLDPERLVVVVGHMSEMVRGAFESADIDFVEQSRQLGTGHAVLVTRDALVGFNGALLVLYGDGPLLRSETLASLLEAHWSSGNAATLLTCMRDNPTGYGRVIRDADGGFQCIIEEKDADAETKKLKEVYSGIAVYGSPEVFDYLAQVKNANAQQEYYLTDLPELMLRDGLGIGTVLHPDAVEVEGFNSKEQYEAVCRSLEARRSQQ